MRSYDLQTCSAKCNTWLLDILFLTLLLGGIFFVMLGARPLLVPEEGRYAEIIREMWVSHDYVTPHLNGVKYFEKPILFYWLGLAAVKLFGVNLWALRSVNALLGLVGCLLTYAVARKWYGRLTGMYAALILGASGLYFGLLHVINVDISTTVFLSTSLFCFLLGIQQKIGLKRRLYFWLAFAASACAVLTKGLVGIVFPIMIVGVWIILLNQWRILKSIYLPSAVLIFCLLALPWYGLVDLRNPEFFHFYFVQQHFLRYATTEIGHAQPVWFFVPVLLAGFFPWIIFLWQAVKKSWMTVRAKEIMYQVDAFLLIWVMLVFLFFSFSQSKLVSYILPMFPPLAILVGRYLAEKFLQRKKFVVLWCATLAFLFVMIPVITLNNTSSTVSLVARLKPILTLQDEVVAYKQYYQDLPFYLGRKVTVVDWRGELEFGSQHQDARDWLIDDETFWQRWHGGRRMYVITDQNEFERLQVKHSNEKICVMGKTVSSVLFTKCL